MNIYEIIGLLAFVAGLAVTLYKLWNLLHKGEKYDLRMGFMLFIGFMIAFLLSFSLVMLQPKETIYVLLFSVVKLFTAMQVIFLFIEIVFYIVRNVVEPQQKAYNAQEAAEKSKGGVRL